MIDIIKLKTEHFYNDHLVSCTDKIHGKDDSAYAEIVKILKSDFSVGESDCTGYETTQGRTYFCRK